jgi:nitrate/nitrite-specific signal transduction histidine kinase
VEVLRIAQEAITNVVRHAHAKNLWLTVLVKPSLVRVVVEDDGDGIAEYVNRRVGAGLANMKARADLLGGTVWVRPRSEGGTSVTLEIVGPSVEPGQAELVQRKAGGDDLLRTILTNVTTAGRPDEVVM